MTEARVRLATLDDARASSSPARRRRPPAGTPIDEIRYRLDRL